MRKNMGNRGNDRKGAEDEAKDPYKSCPASPVISIHDIPEANQKLTVRRLIRERKVSRDIVNNHG